MGRSPCCDKVGLKKGPWTPEEDQKLLAYIKEQGHGSWRALPAKAGLQRCGKSCRLRWTNYLRPDIKRGKFTLQEEQIIIQLHALLGNRWAAIATHLPKRTDNEIKNYWNTHLKKRLAKMGIDPITHKPKSDTLLSSITTDGQSKNAANLSHVAQWESARLEAEARLVRESKIRSLSLQQYRLKPPTFALSGSASDAHGGGGDLESPKSSLTFSENAPPPVMGSMPMILGMTSGSSETGIIKEGEHEWKGQGSSSTLTSFSFTSSLHDMTISMEAEGWSPESLRPNSSHVNVGNVMEECFTNLLLNDSIDRSLSDNGKESDEHSRGNSDGSDYHEDSKNYWNSILNLVNSSPSDSPML